MLQGGWISWRLCTTALMEKATGLSTAGVPGPMQGFLPVLLPYWQQLSFILWLPGVRAMVGKGFEG